MANGPTQLTPFFGGGAQRAPFRIPTNVLGLPGLDDPRSAGALQGFSQGFLRGDQTFADALTRGIAGGFGGFAAGEQFRQQQAQEQAERQAAAQQQEIENRRAQAEAQRKAAADAERVRQFGITEGRLGSTAATDAEIRRANLGLRGQEVGLRRRELERGPKGGVQVETVRMPDGSVRSFRRDDPALDRALQQGGLRFSAQLQAPDVAGLGGATTSTQTRAQATIDTAQDTLGTIQQFRESLRPENIGLSGDVRELGIGALGQAESFRAWADDQTQSIIDQAISSGDTLDLGKFAVDPQLSSQRLLENVLAYRLAKIQDPDGRISDADFRNAKLSLGTGKKLSSIGDVLARVDAFEQTVNRTQDIARQRLGIAPGGQQPAQVGAAPAAEPVFRIEGGALVPVQ